MGFNAQIIARLDTEDIKEKSKVNQFVDIKTGSLEFIWEPTPSTGAFKDKILTHINYKRHKDWPWHDTSIMEEHCDGLS